MPDWLGLSEADRRDLLLTAAEETGRDATLTDGDGLALFVR